jgi:hypothetical protein
MDDDTKLAVWLFAIAIVLYFVYVEVRYQQCVDEAMQNPYMNIFAAKMLCK